MHPQSRLRPTDGGTTTTTTTRPHPSLAAMDALRVSFHLWEEDIIVGGTDDDEYDLPEELFDGHLKLIRRLHGAASVPPSRPPADDDGRSQPRAPPDPDDERRVDLMCSFDLDESPAPDRRRSLERRPDGSSSSGGLVGSVDRDGTEEANRKRRSHSETFRKRRFAAECKRRLSSVRRGGRAEAGAVGRAHDDGGGGGGDRNEFRRGPGARRRRRRRPCFSCVGRRCFYERCDSNRAE